MTKPQLVEAPRWDGVTHCAGIALLLGANQSLKTMPMTQTAISTMIRSSYDVLSIWKDYQFNMGADLK